MSHERPVRPPPPDPKPEAVAPSISATSLTMYGGKMTTFGGSWTSQRGSNGMPYIHANLVKGFKIIGQLPMSRLGTRRRYKGVFHLELTNRSSGWQQGQFLVSLGVPGSRENVRDLSYNWNRHGTFQLVSDTFRLTEVQREANLGFILSHPGPSHMAGLIVKRFVIEEA